MSEMDEPSDLPNMYIATDRLQLSQNSSRHVGVCALMICARLESADERSDQMI